jgi:hypothetical protein
MGTPEDSIVPRVRVNRVTATFLRTDPKIGSFRKRLSKNHRPLGVP